MALPVWRGQCLPLQPSSCECPASRVLSAPLGFYPSWRHQPLPFSSDFSQRWLLLILWVSFCLQFTSSGRGFCPWPHITKPLSPIIPSILFLLISVCIICDSWMWFFISADLQYSFPSPSQCLKPSRCPRRNYWLILRHPQAQPLGIIVWVLQV